MHCQICLAESPHHAVGCPVGTRQAVRGLASMGGICSVCNGQNGVHQWAGPGNCPGAQYDTPQAFTIQALQSQIVELRARVMRLELALDELKK